jgi:hypothetical protein
VSVSRQNTASHLPAVLLFSVVGLAAPSLFLFGTQLLQPIFVTFINALATPAATMPSSFFELATPLFKILGVLMFFSLLASLSALALRRALLR